MVCATKNKDTKLTFQRKQWRQKTTDGIFKVMKGKSNSQPRILYIAKTTFKNEVEIKTFSNRLREPVTSRPALKETPKGR